MNEKILVIYYEPDILRTLENILTNEGYQVRSASGSEEAIDVLKSESFGLVIMDIRMPGVDGVEFMKQVKELVNGIEIVFLTGSPRMKNAVKALRDDGAYDFLTMPMENVDQLINTVKRALRKQKLKNKNR